MMFGRERHFYGIPSCRHCRALPRPPPAPTTATVRVARRPDSLPCCCVPLSSLHFLRSLFTHRRPSRSRTEPYRALGLGYRSKAQPTSDYAPRVISLVKFPPITLLFPPTRPHACSLASLPSARAWSSYWHIHLGLPFLPPSVSLPLSSFVSILGHGECCTVVAQLWSPIRKEGGREGRSPSFLPAPPSPCPFW